MPNDGTQQPQVSGTSPPVEQAVIPPAVRAMSERADALQREFIAAQTGQAQPQPPAPPAEVQPPAPPTNPSPPTDTLPIMPPSQRQHEPVPPDATPPREATDEEIEAVLAMPAEPGSGLALLQHKYRSERGRRARLQAQQEAAPPPPTPIQFEVPEGGDDDEPLIDPATRETYGEELADLIEQTARKAAERIAAKEIKKVVEPLNKREAELTRQGQARLVQSLDAALEPVGIKFVQLNHHDDFIQWLQLPDARSGAKRQDLLRSAWSALDGSRMLTIIGDYLDTALPPPSGGVPEVPQPAPAPTPPAAPRQPQVDLMSLAAPGRAPRTEPVTPLPPTPQKPNYTRAQIRDFYEAKRKGRYSPADAQAIEADIFAAQQENRIIG